MDANASTIGVTGNSRIFIGKPEHIGYNKHVSSIDRSFPLSPEAIKAARLFLPE
jgi:hypothetical protein